MLTPYNNFRKKVADRTAPLGKWRKLGMLSSLGIMFVLSTFIGLGMGILIDRYAGTKPVFTILFLLFGIASAFVSLYREVKTLIEIDNQNGMDDHDGPHE